MNSKKLFAISALTSVMLLNMTACSIPFSKNDAVTSTPADVTTSGQAISLQDDSKVRKLIDDYFIKMYTKPDDYYANNATGNIPDALKDFISSKTYKELNGNPENGLHYPRIVELNGLNVVKLGIDKSISDPKDSHVIMSSCIAKNGDTYVYYVKVPLIGKCLDDAGFAKYYKENPDHIFAMTGTFNDTDLESMRLIAKYEVDVVKEGNTYKIQEAREASEKKGNARRLSKLNNEFVERIPYLLIDATVDGKYKVVDADKKLYENEKKYVEAFFTMVSGLDRIRMNMLGSAWNENDVPKLLGKLSLPSYNALKDKKLTDLMIFDNTFKDKYELASFPLQTDMDSIISISNISVLPHPSYSDKNKRYAVTFNAVIHKTNGIADNKLNYKYTYMVELTGADTSIKVSKVSLDEFKRTDK